MVEKALSGEVFKRIPERLLQTIFMKTAVIPSANAGLLGETSKPTRPPSQQTELARGLKISADGTCIQSHAFPNSHKTCDCPRSYADPEAKCGWDSYHEQWFYGYTAYLLSVHNKELKLNLPI